MKTIDEYIRNISVDSRPILVHLRELIRKASPKIEENIKWNAPSFEVDGKIICSVMAFKKHVNLIFGKGKEMDDPHKLLENIGEKSNMKGIKRITTINDLPKDEILIDYIKEAVAIAGN